MFKNSKYRAVKSEYNGIKFPSKLEMNCYKALEELKNQGKLKYVIRQAPFDLPGGYRHYIDFLAVTGTNKNVFIESKGRDLSTGKMKRKQVESIYGINVHVVTKASEIKDISEFNSQSVCF